MTHRYANFRSSFMCEALGSTYPPHISLTFPIQPRSSLPPDPPLLPQPFLIGDTQLLKIFVVRTALRINWRQTKLPVHNTRKETKNPNHRCPIRGKKET